MGHLARARAGALVATVVVLPSLAAAESPPPAATDAPTATAAPTATGAPTAKDTATATAASTDTAQPSVADAPGTEPRSGKPVLPATGNAYVAAPAHESDRGLVRLRRGSSAGSDALMAGFETLADGLTRVYVDLSRPVTYDAKAGRSTLTYILKGVHVDRRNNQNPLVTVHFNTPVTSARLSPHGRDVWLLVDLRASVQATAKMETTKDGVVELQIDFPKGDYVAPVAEGQSATGASARTASVLPPPASASR